MPFPTNLLASSAPELKGYTCYFRNRTEKHKGGLAILVFDKISKYVTKLVQLILPNHNKILAVRQDKTVCNLKIIIVKSWLSMS